MGLVSQLATIILREHMHCPITGTILSIGRQTVYLSPIEAIRLVEHELGVTIDISPDALEIDTETRGRGESYITDRAFYSLFTKNTSYRCLDVTDYEGADIITDLCAPLPVHLEGIANFIVDGSSLDNIFDPASAIRNLSRLLKPHGRTLHIDRVSRRHNVYVAFALSWFHDYYSINAFDDCQVYLAQWDGEQPSARWDFYQYAPIRERAGRASYFGQDCYYYPWREAHAIVLAEKGERSTWDRTPVQFEYRPGIKRNIIDGKSEIETHDLERNATDPYVANATKFLSSSRKWLRDGELMPLPSQYLHYSPETPYRGSLLPIADHLHVMR
jgi:SAM-dependent methyltransferase